MCSLCVLLFDLFVCVFVVCILLLGLFRLFVLLVVVFMLCVGFVWVPVQGADLGSRGAKNDDDDDKKNV